MKNRRIVRLIRAVNTIEDWLLITMLAVMVVLAVAKLFRPVTTAILAEDVDGNGAPDILFGDQGGYLNIIRR